MTSVCFATVAGADVKDGRRFDPGLKLKGWGDLNRGVQKIKEGLYPIGKGLLSYSEKNRQMHSDAK